MINHSVSGQGRFMPQTGFLRALDAIPWAGHGSPHERFPRHLRHLPRDYELAIRWLRPSFLTREHWTPGQQCPGSRIRMHVPRGFANGSTPPGNTIVGPLAPTGTGIPWNYAFTIP